jgi:hypothetical protein
MTCVAFTCTVATDLHLTGLRPAQQVIGLAQDILTNAEVVSMWPNFFF